MISKSKVPNKVCVFSDEWANSKLRWFIQFLKEDTWKNHPYFKIVTAWQIEDILRCAGYSWQADRVLNHLHVWMKGIKLLDKDSSQNREDFHRSENGLNKVNLGLIQAVDGEDPSRRPGAETRILAKKEFRLQRISADTLREKRIPQ